jgi:hypothetical protein
MKIRNRAWVAGLLGTMIAGVASAEVIYIDFYDNGTVNSSLEAYNVLHSSVGNGAGHPVASANAGLSMTGFGRNRSGPHLGNRSWMELWCCG